MMRGLIITAALTAVIALSACGAAQEEAAPLPLEEAALREEVLPAPEIEEAEERAGETALFFGGGTGLAVELPEGWECQSVPRETADSRAPFGVFPENTCGIAFRPTGEEAACAALLYWPDRFGVCGTGLDEEEAVFSGGLRGRIGRYDGQPQWNFVVLEGLPGSFAAVNSGLAGETAETALAIVGTARLSGAGEPPEEWGALADTPDQIQHRAGGGNRLPPARCWILQAYSKTGDENFSCSLSLLVSRPLRGGKWNVPFRLYFSVTTVTPLSPSP